MNDTPDEKWDVSLTRPPKTDRDLWAEPSHGFMLWSLAQQSRREEVSAGLRAFAAAYFDDYTDATDLPTSFWRMVAMADEILGDLDLPTRTDEEDDES